MSGFSSDSFLAGLAVGRQLKGWATRNAGGYPEPTGTLTITANGTYDVKNKAAALVAVASGQGRVAASMRVGTSRRLSVGAITVPPNMGGAVSVSLIRRPPVTLPVGTIAVRAGLGGTVAASIRTEIPPTFRRAAAIPATFGGNIGISNVTITREE